MREAGLRAYSIDYNARGHYTIIDEDLLASKYHYDVQQEYRDRVNAELRPNSDDVHMNLAADVNINNDGII